MDKDTAQKPTDTSEKHSNLAERAKTDAKLKAILADLDRPLDEILRECLELCT